MKVTIFGFKGTIAQDVIGRINGNFDSKLIDSSEAAVKAFVDYVDTVGSCDYLIGLGSYSGVDNRQIRIELKATSQFRNDSKNCVSVRLRYFFKANIHFKIARGMGNSYCNLVSYQLARSSSRPYTFLHVPKSYNSADAAAAINDQLELLRLNT